MIMYENLSVVCFVWDIVLFLVQQETKFGI